MAWSTALSSCQRRQQQQSFSNLNMLMIIMHLFEKKIILLAF